MKRVIAIITVSVLILSLSACKSKNDKPAVQEDTTTTVVTTQNNTNDISGVITEDGHIVQNQSGGDVEFYDFENHEQVTAPEENNPETQENIDDGIGTPSNDDDSVYVYTGQSNKVIPPQPEGKTEAASNDTVTVPKEYRGKSLNEVIASAIK